MTNSKEDSELRTKLKGYNWTSDKDYQLACIAFRELAITKQESDRRVLEMIGEDEEVETYMGWNGETEQEETVARNQLRAELRELLNGDKQ